MRNFKIYQNNITVTQFIPRIETSNLNSVVGVLIGSTHWLNLNVCFDPSNIIIMIFANKKNYHNVTFISIVTLRNK